MTYLEELKDVIHRLHGVESAHLAAGMVAITERGMRMTPAKGVRDE